MHCELAIVGRGRPSVVKNDDSPAGKKLWACAHNRGGHGARYVYCVSLQGARSKAARIGRSS